MDLSLTELLERMFKDAVESYEEFLLPVKLKTLGQRYGKKLRGADLYRTLREDSRFLVLTLETGGRIVFPREAFEASLRADVEMLELDPVTARRNTLKAYGVRVM